MSRAHNIYVLKWDEVEMIYHSEVAKQISAIFSAKATSLNFLAAFMLLLCFFSLLDHLVFIHHRTPTTAGRVPNDTYIYCWLLLSSVVATRNDCKLGKSFARCFSCFVAEDSQDDKVEPSPSQKENGDLNGRVAKPTSTKF